jgi:hypothetical protein
MECDFYVMLCWEKKWSSREDEEEKEICVARFFFRCMK